MARSRSQPFGHSIGAMASNDNRIDALLSQVGELRGTTAAMNTMLQSLSGELVRMNADVNAKHQENLRVINEHTKEDKVNFDRVNRIVYMCIGGLILAEFVAKLLFK